MSFCSTYCEHYLNPVLAKTLSSHETEAYVVTTNFGTSMDINVLVFDLLLLILNHTKANGVLHSLDILRFKFRW